MTEPQKTGALSPWNLMLRMGIYAAILSAIGIFIALLFIQSTLRLSPAQLLEGLSGMLVLWPPLLLLDILVGYRAFQPLRGFLQTLQLGSAPSAEEAPVVMRQCFRFPVITSLASAALWCIGAAAVGGWCRFRAELGWFDFLIFVASGVFLGALTSLFNFFLVRHLLRPVQELLKPFLPPAAPALLSPPLTLRRKLTFSFTYLILSVLAGMVIELYYFQQRAIWEQGVAEAGRLAAAAALAETKGRAPAVSAEGFGYRVRLFQVNAVGDLQAGDLEPDLQIRLQESPYLLGQSAFAQAHPLRTKLTNLLSRIVLAPDYLLFRVPGRTLACLLPNSAGNPGVWGALVERVARPEPARRRYPSLLHFLVNHPTSLLAGFVFSCLGLALLLTYLIIMDVAGPLRRLQATARSLQEGALSVRARLDTNDEIGLLILDFNRMADRLALKVNESERLVAALREATRHLGANTERIVEIAAGQAAGATEQAASIQEVSSTSEEMAATLKVISESARGVEQVAGQTLLACRQGQEDLVNILAGMDRINSRVREIAQEMLHLQEHSLKIESILDLIREVAEKTNLISLNASIEAAAAGEAGRRFSIIANEVRELAEQTAGSIREIREMISLLQQATNRTIMVTEEGTKQADATHLAASQVNRSFQNLTALAEETAAAAKEIALSSSQQTSASEHLAATISEINTVARGFVDSAREIETSTFELNRLAETLRQMVGPNGDPKHRAPDFVPSFPAGESPDAKEKSHDQ